MPHFLDNEECEDNLDIEAIVKIISKVYNDLTKMNLFHQLPKMILTDYRYLLILTFIMIIEKERQSSFSTRIIPQEHNILQSFIPSLYVNENYNEVS